MASKVVSENDIGWSIPYDYGALENYLQKILCSPDELNSKQQNLIKIANNHTWVNRALKVVSELKISGKE